MLRENPLPVLYFARTHLFPYALVCVCVCAHTFNLCYFLIFSAVLLPMRDFVAWILSSGHYWDSCVVQTFRMLRFHYVVSTAVHSLTSPLTTPPPTAAELFKDWQRDASKILNFLLGRSSLLLATSNFKLIFLIWQAHSVTILDNT